MHLARKMLSDGVISEKEYCRIDTMFTQKYKPVFGTLFSDIRLTNPADRVMYSTEEA
ncbi:SHOCT domain-containing protein [Candidatus Pseudoruminococcus sp.]|uniref:SHOCT domain-containing protein n=1 Tax=Candidatus Pseudoruminococcus sp. TaxID=3101048 RepID=UPI00399C0228